MQANPLLEATIRVLDRLVSFDTTSSLSNLTCIEYIEYYLQSLGIPSTRIFNDDKTKASLVATIGPRKPGGVVFSGHTDVVPVKGQPWTTDPFALSENSDGQRLHGRGTCDMKGFLACVLAMVPYMKMKAQAPVHLAFSYDEEVGCLAAPAIAEFLGQQTWKPSLVVIGEPTEMQVIDAHKSCYSFATQVVGLEGHSSKPHLGANAVMIAADLIHLLNLLSAEYRQPNKTNPRFDPPFTTIHVGKIQGGIARNIIPNACEFIWEIRSLPGQDIQPILQRVYARSDELMHHMRVVAPEARITTTQMTYVPGLRPDIEGAHSHCVMHSANRNSASAVSFATEAGFFQGQGFTTLVCGPGNIEQAHKANEFVTRDQLALCLKFIERLINTYK